MTTMLRFNVRDNGSWEFVPQWLWSEIVERFIDESCAVGFRWLERPDQVPLFPFVQRLNAIPEGSITYRPYSVPGSADIDTYCESVLSFPVTPAIKDKLRHLDLRTMWPDDDELPTEEIVVAGLDGLILSAPNVDSHITFYNLSRSDHSALRSLSDEITLDEV